MKFANCLLKPRYPSVFMISIVVVLLLAAAVTAVGQGNRIQTEIVELGAEGFTPKTITRKAGGHYYLRLRVVTRERPLDLYLERNQGGRVRTISLLQGQMRWKDLLDLTPGSYVLREANHPEWVCTINIGN